MATGVELATAWIRIVPSMDGATDAITKDLTGIDSKGAGEKIGDDLSKGISTKQAAIAGAVGGIFASLASDIGRSIGDLFSDAIVMSDATDKFAQTLNFAGLDTSAIKTATAEARGYADSTVYDLATVQNTMAQLASNGIENFGDLTKAAGNLNAVAGGNEDTFSSVAQMLTQTAGAGKLTTENWNQLADAIPGASGRLQDALLESGSYVGNFRDAMAAGEITSDEFNAALMSLGTEPIAVEAASSVTTMEGAMGNLSASITGVLADAFTAIKPILTGFTSGLADFISNSDVFIPVISGLGAALLVALAPALWGVVTATWAFTAALLANPLTWIVVGIAALVAGIVALAMNWDTVTAWITDVWSGFITWITDVIDGFVGWWNGVWGAVGSFIATVWNNIVTWVGGAANNIASFIVTAVDGIRTTWENVWTGIGNFLKDIWNNILGWIEGGVNGAIDLINGLMGGIKDVAGFIGIDVGVISHVRLPRLADGATVLPRPGGTAAILAEAGRPESVVDTGLMNQALEEGLSGNQSAGVTQNITLKTNDPRLAIRQLGREAQRGLAAS